MFIKGTRAFILPKVCTVTAVICFQKYFIFGVNMLFVFLTQIISFLKPSSNTRFKILKNLYDTYNKSIDALFNLFVNFIITFRVITAVLAIL